jgi:cyclopropane fatty-acyl-phospholipid synthase-like methyltransferase
MEKIRIGCEMATRWTDPTMVLIYMIPIIVAHLIFTGYFGFLAYPDVMSVIESGKAPEGEALNELVLKLCYVVLPTFLCALLYNFVHGHWFEDPSVDTTKFVIFRDPAMAAKWKHRRLPMCEVYEWYLNEKFDWNPECEGGDTYKILCRRGEFVHYKPTAGQLKWLIIQFLPKWMTCGSGLGYGSSSGKTIAETTKEIDEHYNKGNDVFSCMLGKAMVYTCGIFHEVPQFASSGHDGDYAASANDGELEKAQGRKMDMICDKLHLKEGETFLDIGCGWGTLARHAAKRGAKATGVTLSIEGKLWCEMAAEKEGVPTEILHCDYRDIPTDRKFDKIASIEMAEHVGIANFQTYLGIVKGLLKRKDSMFMMQVAGLRQGSQWEDVQWGLWMVKYIFPGADASTPLNWYIRQCEQAGFEVHSVETIGNHYSHTLHKWYDNWHSNESRILNGEIDAISEHSKGVHMFRLNSFAWAWATIHAGQGGGTCYQILMHPCEYTFPRDIWVDGKHVTNSGVTGVGLGEQTQAAEEASATPARGRRKSVSAKTRVTSPSPKARAKTPARTPRVLPPRSAKK